MIAKSFITSMKLLEEATSFAIERITGYLSMSYEVDGRYDLISVISPQNLHDATETGHINKIRGAVPRVLYIQSY
jgi:hypothetical protein